MAMFKALFMHIFRKLLSAYSNWQTLKIRIAFEGREAARCWESCGWGTFLTIKECSVHYSDSQ